ncbi:MAG: TrmB family transcriptional regulator [Nitrospiraceae bacterium]|nr:MAG: TrmB family transcriptional regulator [Nitrospiraceae bacterium]
MQTAVLKLKHLGFSEYEAKAYMALVHENPLTAYELSKNSGIPSSKIYEVLRKLELRHMIQLIRGERTKMFVPIPPDEFVRNFRSSIEDNLHAVRTELTTVKPGLDSGYMWHIKNYETLIHRAKRMINTARESLLVLIWKEEMKELAEALTGAVQRGIRTAVIHYGFTDFKISRIYIHPVEDTVYEAKKVRGFTLVSDLKEAVNGRIDSKGTDAVWSMNEGFVTMAEDYLRHDIYLMKTLQRFAPVMRKKFGDRYEKLRDVYADEAY